MVHECILIVNNLAICKNTTYLKNLPLPPYPCFHSPAPKPWLIAVCFATFQPLLYVNEHINLKLNRHFPKEDIADGNRHMKDVRHHKSSGKCKSKPPWAITSHLSEWSLSKRQQITSIDEDAERKEPSCTVGGSVNLCSHYGKHYGCASKIKNRAIIWSRNSSPGYSSEENENTDSKRYMHLSVHSIIIYNCQDMEAT